MTDAEHTSGTAAIIPFRPTRARSLRRRPAGPVHPVHLEGFREAHQSIGKALAFLRSAYASLDEQAAEVREGVRLDDINVMLKEAWAGLDATNSRLFDIGSSNGGGLDVLAKSLCDELFDTMDILHLVVCATRSRALPNSGTTCNPVYGALTVMLKRAGAIERRIRHGARGNRL